MKGNQENAKNKNMSIKLVGGGAGGVGLAGIILLGGALALVTTFAFKRKQISKSEKNKQKDSSNKSIENVDHNLLVGEGLSFLVPDSLSPHLDDHSSSNGTVDTQDEVSTHIFLLDKIRDTNVGNEEEMYILEKERNNYFCDKSSVSREDLPVQLADSLLPLKPEEVNKKSDYLEEVEVMKVNKDSITTDCNQVGDSCNDWQVPLRIDGNNQELVEAAHSDDQLGLDGKTHEQGEECDGKGKILTERKEMLVEGAQSNQPGTDDDTHKLQDECVENGEIVLEKRKEPTEAAVRDQTRLDQMPHRGGEECGNDTGIIIEKCEELIEEVVENWMILSEELEATAMNGDQDILCSDGTVLIRNETEICDFKKPELLLPQKDSSSVTKPGGNDLFKDRLVTLVVKDAKISKEDETNEPAVQDDHSKVEDSEQTQLVEAQGDNKEYYQTYIENINDKFEEADEISVKNDQKMQSWEECQKIHTNGNQEKYNSGKSLPETDSFDGNGFEVQEFSFPPLDCPSLIKPGKLHKYDSEETTLHVEVINPMEKDGLDEEVFAYQIVLENNPSIQSAENDELQFCDDGGDSATDKGEETLETSLVDIAQPTKLDEEEGNNDDSKEDEEAVEITQKENFEAENNLQLPQKDHDNNDSVDREEYDNDCNDGDVEDDNDEDDNDEDTENDTEEEETVEEVEESSETTGDSSLDSSTEAIWPDEPVLEFSEKINDMQANDHDFKEIVEKDSYVKFNSHKLEDEDEDEDSFMMAYSEKLSADTTTLKQPTNIFNLKFLFLSLLVPFLLLLWLSLSQLSYFTSFHYYLE